jgi:large subunit ribosomal protein L22
MKEKNLEIKAICRGLNMVPNKVRRVLMQLRGKECKDAMILLKFLPYRACLSILKLLMSAIANAENNFGFDVSNLFVKFVRVDRGRIIKRWRARARGKAFKILKPTSHVTIIVGVI